MIPIQDNPGPRRSIPWVTWGLIAINIVVFLYQVTLGPDVETFIFAYSVVPIAILKGIPQTDLPGVPAGLPFHTPVPVYLTVFSSMFMHAGWLHLGGNILYLFIFGDNVEDRMGHIPYLLFYLFCGIVASAAQILVDPTSTVPSLGASGAIAGVLASYLVLFPWAGVRTIVFLFVFISVVTLPAILLIGIWFALQFFDGLAALSQTQQGGGVAYFAHIGGFVAGLVITFLLQSFMKPSAPVSYPTYPRHQYSDGPTRWW
jgi:membrane associated rhomboid family serine protease